MNNFLDKTILVGFLLLLVFTALAHGAVEFWSVALCSTGLVVILLLWVLKGVGEKTWTIHVPTPAWAFAAVIVWGVIQNAANLSLDSEATQRAIVWLVLLWLAFIVAANTFASRARWQTLGAFLSFFGLALAFFALIQQATWNGRFYWLRAPSGAEVSAPFGPFVHHGHYAGYVDLLLPIPIAFLITQSQRLEKKLLYGFAATLMGLSVIVSLARGGMLGLGAQLLFLAIMSGWLARQRRNGWEDTPSPFMRRRVGAVVAIGVIMLLGVLWIGVEPVLDRIAQGSLNGAVQAESFFNNRGWIWRDTWAMFRAHPLTGVGLGAFATAFPIYSLNDGSVTVSAAHNDYLQILAESGLVGGALAIWFIVAMFQALSKALRSHDPNAQALALGAGAGIVGMLVHSFFDFNLQLPSHALLFLTMIAVITRLGAKATELAAAIAEEVQPDYAEYVMTSERLPEKGTS
jgi:O-antigen ligase